ncbi:MAG: orotate phosphoribosyltransferase [Cellvibrionales bacterium]|nr:orotate phosphoribosyltransferase [Cellvibrionales bacterium]
MMTNPIKTPFIEAAIDSEALLFGEFTLKSGRVSPYFFNAGKMVQGKTLATLAACYADTIQASGLDFDVLFGPAYKGISLAALTAAALYERHGIDKPFAYNRKEKKAHGEGGQLVGADIQDKKLLIIDDVITAGTAIKEVAALIDGTGASLAGVVIGLDRQEKGQTDISAIAQIQKDFDITIKSIIQLEDIVDYLSNNAQHDTITKINDYRATYGAQE